MAGRIELGVAGALERPPHAPADPTHLGGVGDRVRLGNVGRARRDLLEHRHRLGRIGLEQAASAQQQHLIGAIALACPRGLGRSRGFVGAVALRDHLAKRERSHDRQHGDRE